MCSGLTPDLVISLMGQGVRQVDIAAEFGVSRQYVCRLAKEAGHVSSTTIVNDNLPWEVSGDYQKNNIYQALRCVAHLNLKKQGTFPDTMSPSSIQKAETLIRKLTNYDLVIDFDPTYPAIPGYANTPGFAYLHREDADEDYLIKIRPGVKITHLGYDLWKLPTLNS